jgi:hypothetical protein
MIAYDRFAPGILIPCNYNPLNGTPAAFNIVIEFEAATYKLLSSLDA